MVAVAGALTQREVTHSNHCTLLSGALLMARGQGQSLINTYSLQRAETQEGRPGRESSISTSSPHLTSPLLPVWAVPQADTSVWKKLFPLSHHIAVQTGAITYSHHGNKSPGMGRRSSLFLPEHFVPDGPGLASPVSGYGVGGGRGIASQFPSKSMAPDLFRSKVPEAGRSFPLLKRKHPAISRGFGCRL